MDLIGKNESIPPGGKYLIDNLLDAPEPDVDQDRHRCHICRTITYEKFRADSTAGELFHKKTFIIGSFEYLRRSSLAGCYFCRLLFRRICQVVTHSSQTTALFYITKIGLRLSIDDELTLHYWTDSGPASLGGNTFNPIRLEISSRIDLESSEDEENNDEPDNSTSPSEGTCETGSTQPGLISFPLMRLEDNL
jgi:hypothetical protein